MSPVERYYRLSGGGNDFLALADPDDTPAAEEIRALCRRGLSLGADGLFVLRPTATGAQMDYFNADGEGAALCLNGTRCAARLAFELGWAEEKTEILTGAGAMAAEAAGEDSIALAVDPPRGDPAPLEIAAGGETLTGWRVLIGVPHFVLMWPETLAHAPLAELGPTLRRAPELGSAGANVDFVRYPARDRIEIRTWERGVEAETLACGTGALAAAAVGLAEDRCDLPAEVLTQGGCVLTIAGEVDDRRPVAWTLAGDARLLARAETNPAATRIPLPPDWSA